MPEEDVSVTRVAASTGGAADGARSLRRYAEDGLGELAGPVFLAGGAEVKVADGIADHSGSQVRHSGAAGHGGPVAAPV